MVEPEIVRAEYYTEMQIKNITFFAWKRVWVLHKELQVKVDYAIGRGGVIVVEF